MHPFQLLGLIGAAELSLSSMLLLFTSLSQLVIKVASDLTKLALTHLVLALSRSTSVAAGRS